MKTTFTALLLAFALIASSQQARAEVIAPPGSYFEVQVEYATVSGPSWRPIISDRWDTYAGPFKSLNLAEDKYDVLADAADAGKLAQLLGYNRANYPIAARLVFIIYSNSPFVPDQVTIVESTE